MQCEICGEENVLVLPSIFEATRVYACKKCIDSHRLTVIKPKGKIKDRKTSSRFRPKSDMAELYSVLVEGYGYVVRSAREARALTQEDLAKLLNERVSTVKKIESEKLTPSSNLIRKLEHVLKIRLLDRLEMETLDQDEEVVEGRRLTLGDLAIFREEGE